MKKYFLHECGLIYVEYYIRVTEICIQKEKVCFTWKISVIHICTQNLYERNLLQGTKIIMKVSVLYLDTIFYHDPDISL